MSRVRFEMIDKETGEVWFRGVSVTPQDPCPICGHPTSRRREGYCVIDKEREMAWCGHAIAFGARPFYRLNPNNSKMEVYATPSRIKPKEDEGPIHDFRAMHESFFRYGQVQSGVMQKDAIALGVPLEFLLRIGAGIDPKFPTAMTFPMRDIAGNVIGIRYRGRGKKWAAKGSRNALFIDVTNDLRETVLSPEGPTDTAACLAMGFSAIGRPAAMLGGNYLSLMGTGRHLVLVSDNDNAGMVGCRKIAAGLTGKWASVRIVTPPAAYKDVREWYKSGARRAEMQAAINNADTI